MSEQAPESPDLRRREDNRRIALFTGLSLLAGGVLTAGQAFLSRAIGIGPEHYGFNEVIKLAPTFLLASLGTIIQFEDSLRQNWGSFSLMQGSIFASGLGADLLISNGLNPGMASVLRAALPVAAGAIAHGHAFFINRERN